MQEYLTNSSAGQELGKKTHQLITDFYHKKQNIFDSLLHPDVLWTGADDGQYIQGYSPVLSYIRKLSTDILQCHIKTNHYNILYVSHLICIITGCISSLIRTNSRDCFSATQHLTIIWKKCGFQWKILHIHFSNSLDTQKNLEYFSDEAGSETYQYTELPPSEWYGSENPLCLRGANARTFLISPDEILYIEAANMNCDIHTLTRIINICQPMGHLIQLLPAEFLRIHRCYVVNRKYIHELCRYYILLSNRCRLPVPEKKYKWLREVLVGKAIS